MTIREWAKANGYPIGDRGRISGDVQAAFFEAQAARHRDARIWARNNGIAVGVRGKVPESVLAAFDASRATPKSRRRRSA